MSYAKFSGSQPMVRGVQLLSNLCTTLGTPNLWPLFTGGRCSVVVLCYNNLNRDSKNVVTVGRWSLLGFGR